MTGLFVCHSSLLTFYSLLFFTAHLLKALGRPVNSQGQHQWQHGFLLSIRLNGRSHPASIDRNHAIPNISAAQTPPTTKRGVVRPIDKHLMLHQAMTTRAVKRFFFDRFINAAERLGSCRLEHGR